MQLYCISVQIEKPDNICAIREAHYCLKKHYLYVLWCHYNTPSHLGLYLKVYVP
jgi:hypothetical protein